jgi:hypothetical protein
VLYIHTHTTGYATWVTLESRRHNSGADQSFPISLSCASFSSYFFFIHISLFSARCLSSPDLNPPSELQLSSVARFFSILIVEETGVPGGNHLAMLHFFGIILSWSILHHHWTIGFKYNANKPPAGARIISIFYCGPLTWWRFSTPSYPSSLSPSPHFIPPSYKSKDHNNPRHDLKTLTLTLWHWLRAHSSWKAIHRFSIEVRKGRVLSRSYRLYLMYCLKRRAERSNCWKKKQTEVKEVGGDLKKIFFKFKKKSKFVKKKCFVCLVSSHCMPSFC